MTTTPPATTTRRDVSVDYDAFVSYSHAADGRLAPRLQQGLHALGKPWYRRRALRAFRDKTSLTATPELWESIVRALGSVRFFVLLASPEAAASRWVGQEVEWWLTHRSPERLLIVLTAGELHWDDAAGDFDWTRTIALPEVLRGALRQEPLWVDLRWAHTEEQVSRRDPRFQDAIADLAAPMRGIPKEDLLGEDVRQHRRALLLARSAVVALVVLLVAVGTAGAIAVRQRNEAREQLRIATARQLVAQADAARDTDPRTALLLGIAAHHIRSDGETQASLVNTLTTTHYAGTLSGHNGPVNAVAFASDGRTLATGSVRLGDNTAILWNVADRVRPRELARVCPAPPDSRWRSLPTGGHWPPAAPTPRSCGTWPIESDPANSPG